MNEEFVLKVKAQRHDYQSVLASCALCYFWECGGLKGLRRSFYFYLGHKLHMAAFEFDFIGSLLPNFDLFCNFNNVIDRKTV